MEHITRIGMLFGVITLTSLFAIILANGELMWATIGLMLLFVLIVALGVGLWTLIHNTFPAPVEIGLTIAIIAALIAVLMVVALAGREIFDALAGVVGNHTAWWLIAPLIGTAAIRMIFGVGRRRA
jgi:hypothetical protein